MFDSRHLVSERRRTHSTSARSHTHRPLPTICTDRNLSRILADTPHLHTKDSVLLRKVPLKVSELACRVAHFRYSGSMGTMGGSSRDQQAKIPNNKFSHPHSPCDPVVSIARSHRPLQPAPGYSHHSPEGTRQLYPQQVQCRLGPPVPITTQALQPSALALSTPATAPAISTPTTAPMPQSHGTYRVMSPALYSAAQQSAFVASPAQRSAGSAQEMPIDLTADDKQQGQAMPTRNGVPSQSSPVVSQKPIAKSTPLSHASARPAKRKAAPNTKELVPEKRPAMRLQCSEVPAITKQTVAPVRASKSRRKRQAQNARPCSPSAEKMAGSMILEQMKLHRAAELEKRELRDGERKIVGGIDVAKLVIDGVHYKDIVRMIAPHLQQRGDKPQEWPPQSFWDGLTRDAQAAQTACTLDVDADVAAMLEGTKDIPNTVWRWEQARNSFQEYDPDQGSDTTLSPGEATTEPGTQSENKPDDFQRAMNQLDAWDDEDLLEDICHIERLRVA